MYQCRLTRPRIRQGDSDREIASSKIMGARRSPKCASWRAHLGCLAPDTALPDDAILASALVRKDALPSTCISTLEPWCERDESWIRQSNTRSHDALLASRAGYQGNVGAVSCVLQMYCQYAKV